jgi:hypothetical protein
MDLNFPVFDNIQGRMEKINRKLSVHFNSKLLTGIKHENMLSELEKEINLEDITSIQMTEKSIGAQFNI